MKGSAVIIAKTAFAAIVSLLLCMLIGAFSYISHEIGTYNPSTVFASMLNGFDLGEDMSDSLVPLGSPETSNGGSVPVPDVSDVPDDMPAAFGQADGTIYTYEETVTDDDGNESHIYSTGEPVELNDGGLGDAELVITD